MRTPRSTEERRTSTTDNVTFTHVLNVKRLAEGRPPVLDV